MTRRHILLAAGLLIAGWFAFFADKSPSDGIAAPVARSSVSASVATSTATSAIATVAAAGASESGVSATAGKADHPHVILALLARETLIGGAHAGNQAAPLFASQSWTPPPPPPPPPAKAVAPTAPPLPFTYLGKKNEDSNWEVYLARGEQTFIVKAQSTIEGAYRIDAITPPTMSVTYLPLNQKQNLNIGGTD